MLDAICLSEEELAVLFSPASYGDSHPMLDLRPSRAGRKSSSSQARKKKTRGSKASTKTPSPVVPARCGYRTGKCQNLQAIKRNGKLHKLCEFHRERANLNQKKLDRKKRMQRSKMSTAESEDDVKAKAHTDRSPRTVDAPVTNDVFFIKAEAELILSELDTELFLPTSLDEAPLMLGCEELAIFCSLMTFDTTHRSRNSPSVYTPSCHYYTGTV